MSTLYLVFQVINNSKVFGVVMRNDGSALVPFSDLFLKVAVLLLQGADLFQIDGQAVIQVLHGGFLVGPNMEVQAIGQAKTPSRTKGQTLARRDAGAMATCSSVNTHGPVAEGSGTHVECGMELQIGH